MLATLKGDRNLAFNLLMMFMVWSAMSFGINLLTFYTKYLPGDVYGNSMVIGLAALFYTTAGPLAKKLESKKILTVAYSLASIGALSLLSAVSLCTS